MFGLGPVEFVIVMVFVGAMAFAAVAMAFVVGKILSGKFQGPKHCPKCGVELRR